MKSSQPSAAELAAVLENSGASEYVIGGARGAGGGAGGAAEETLYIKETRARANKSDKQTNGKQNANPAENDTSSAPTGGAETGDGGTKSDTTGVAEIGDDAATEVAQQSAAVCGEASESEAKIEGLASSAAQVAGKSSGLTALGAPERPGGRINSLIKAADALSLGLSMVIAVLIGLALGIWLAGFWPPLLWLGVALGVAAAVNNVYKAYRRMLAMDDGANADEQGK